MRDIIPYAFRNGKNAKLPYYIGSHLRLMIPRWWLRWRLRQIMRNAGKRSDYEYILERVNFYNALDNDCGKGGAEWDKLSVENGLQKPTPQSVYYLDAMVYARYFAPEYKWRLLPGDITYVPSVPSIVKSRPIVPDSRFSVIMKLNRIRHFIFVKDDLSFTEKADRTIFRGKVKNLDNRILFMKKFFGHERVDCGDTGRDFSPWKKEKATISEHLKYRYIMSLEGNDVASNLKWIMSSNSIAITPVLKNESWFMESKLIPNYHFIAIKEDFSDLEEKMDYYSEHTDEAEEIIRHAHEYVNQFRDKEREKIISLLVLDKYFKQTS